MRLLDHFCRILFCALFGLDDIFGGTENLENEPVVVTPSGIWYVSSSTSLRIGKLIAVQGR
jgi:hypothetical protein